MTDTSAQQLPAESLLTGVLVDDAAADKAPADNSPDHNAPGDDALPEGALPDGVERQRMDVDIACVGFGPAMGGFLHTLSRGLLNEDGAPAVESKAMPGMPPQVICYERADDIGFGVSGVVTKGRGIRASFPDLDLSQIPLATRVTDEKVVFLLDPHGASRRPGLMRVKEAFLRAVGLAKTMPMNSRTSRISCARSPAFCSPWASSTSGPAGRSWARAWRRSGRARPWPNL